jgi:hypothetical protein
MYKTSQHLGEYITQLNAKQTLGNNDFQIFSLTYQWQYDTADLPLNSSVHIIVLWPSTHDILG